MSDLITTETGGLMSLLHNQNGELAVPKPFEKDISYLILILPEHRISMALKNWKRI